MGKAKADKAKGASGGGKSGKGGDGADGPQIENRKARHDFHILDTIECGIVLQGSEVKSVRDGKMSLGEGFVRVEGYGAKARGPARRSWAPGLYLHGVNIGEYAPAGRAGSVGQHLPTRVRSLLAHKREMAKLAKQVEVKGMTLVPLKVYFKNGKAKVLIGVARGKQAHDKREAIAERETRRDMDRAMSRRV